MSDEAASSAPAEPLVLEGSSLPAEVLELHPDDDQVLVRLEGHGQGEEAVVPLGDFRVARSDTPAVAVGDRTEVHVEQRTNDGKRWVASRDKVVRLAAFKTVQEAYRGGELVEGEIVGSIEGGFSVDVGVRAFLPASQVGMRPVKRPDEILGQRLTFKIIRFDRNRQNVVLSRRILLEADRDQRLARLREGAVVEGTVRSFTDYGAFVDIGSGIEGLLHIEEMGWSRIKRPQDVVKANQSIKCKVIGLDRAKKRISLSLRQLQDDPWLTIEQKYPAGATLKGLVVSKTDFGVFLDLEPGLEGLVLSSGALVAPGDAAALRKVDLGDELEAKVVDIDLEGRRLSLVLVREA